MRCGNYEPLSSSATVTDNKSSGEVDWVQIDLGDDNHDHMIKPEDRMNLAMARQ
jgi:hypothetical protein